MTKKIRWGHLSIRKGSFFRVGGEQHSLPLVSINGRRLLPERKGWGAGRERERYANRWKAVVDKQGGEASKKRRSGERSNPGDFRGRALSLLPGDSFPLPRFPFIRLESIEKSIVSSETTTALIRLSITALGVPTLLTLTRRKQMNLRLEKNGGNRVNELSSRCNATFLLPSHVLRDLK